MGTPIDKSAELLTRISAQLEELKRLTIMQLVVSGAQSSHIAKALGVDQSVISRMMPVREIKKVSGRTKDE
jgi:IS30 family transposase